MGGQITPHRVRADHPGRHARDLNKEGVIEVIRAVWNGAVVAEAERTRRVEGNHYFPPASLRREYFTDSPTRSLCPWKGIAHYYLLTVDGEPNPDAAWYYPHPLPLARLFGIKNHVAFWNGVHIEQD